MGGSRQACGGFDAQSMGGIQGPSDGVGEDDVHEQGKTRFTNQSSLEHYFASTRNDY